MDGSNMDSANTMNKNKLDAIQDIDMMIQRLSNSSRTNHKDKKNIKDYIGPNMNSISLSDEVEESILHRLINGEADLDDTNNSHNNNLMINNMTSGTSTLNEKLFSPTDSNFTSDNSPSLMQTPTLLINDNEDLAMNEQRRTSNFVGKNQAVHSSPESDPKFTTLPTNSNGNGHDNLSQFLAPNPTNNRVYNNCQTNENVPHYLSASNNASPYLSPQDTFLKSNNLMPVSPGLPSSPYISDASQNNLSPNNDDLLSVYSNNSAYSNTSYSSNTLLPVNSLGYKHISTVDDLDILLGDLKQENIALDMDLDILNTATPPALSNILNNNNIRVAPTISVQEFDDVLQTGNHSSQPQIKLESGMDMSLFDQDNLTLRLNDFKLDQQEFSPMFENNDMKLNSSLFLQPSSAEDTTDGHNEMIQGRKERRKSRSGSSSRPVRNNRSRSRSRSRGRTLKDESSIYRSLSLNSNSTKPLSFDEKARSISQNRDKLLEMADLKVDEDSPEDQDDSMDMEIIDDNFNVNGQNSLATKSRSSSQKNPANYACELCDKKFTRPYNLKSHLRTHTNERPFICTVCGKAFARQHDRKRHEDLHSGKKRYVCGGKLKDDTIWGCGKKFARSDALGRHFKTEYGRKCIAPLYEEAAKEKVST